MPQVKSTLIKSDIPSHTCKDIRCSLHVWFSVFKRNFPWRTHTFLSLEEKLYWVWVCEVMSQQTTMAVVVPKFLKWIEVLPSVHDLACCSEETLRTLWQGLGYYARARSLHQASQIIVAQGYFPKSYAEWLSVKGCGLYTAAMVSSLCFQEPVLAVDGNITRVLARFFNDSSALVWTPSGLNTLREKGRIFIGLDHPGLDNEALIELGSLVCKKASPECERCPLQKHCLAYAHNTVNACPALRERPQSVRTKLYALTDAQHPILVLRPQESVFLSHTWGFFLCTEADWIAMKKWMLKYKISYKESQESVKHTITHHKIQCTCVQMNGLSLVLWQSVYRLLYKKEPSAHDLQFFSFDYLAKKISSALDEKILKQIELTQQ